MPSNSTPIHDRVLCSIHASSEIWKDIPKYEGFYQASTRGRVRSVSRMGNYGKFHKRFVSGRILKPYNRLGYQAVGLRNKERFRELYVHDIIPRTFVGPRPPRCECRHFPDSTRTHNCIENIQWGTYEEQNQDKVIHGTSNRGEQHPLSVLTEADVRRIRRLYAMGGYSYPKLGRIFDVHPTTILGIVQRLRWKHVD